jgi:hypothetical protein
MVFLPMRCHHYGSHQSSKSGFTEVLVSVVIKSAIASLTIQLSMIVR